MKKYGIGIVLLLSLALTQGQALSLWRHPEAAEKNALFLDVTIASISFDDGFAFHFGLPMEIRVDYLLPLPLPFSAGLFFKTPYPNLKSFGTRLAYHIDIGNAKTDLYLVYVFDFGFTRSELLAEYNDTAPPLRFWDFRLGIRRLFGSRFCIGLETDYKFLGLLLMISLKLN